MIPGDPRRCGCEHAPVHPQLLAALEPILRDLRAGGVPEPRIVGDDWPGQVGVAGAILWSSDGSGSGVSVVLDEPFPQQVASVADQVQEWAIEELWGTDRTNWPACPAHPGAHPLVVGDAGSAVDWVCPRSGIAVCRVGELG